MRIASVVSVVLMAAAIAFALTNRGRLEARIDARRHDYASCVHRTGTPAACGWRHLDQLAQVDLLALPFLAIGLGLFLLLVYKIEHPPAEPRVSPIGEARVEDTLM